MVIINFKVKIITCIYDKKQGHNILLNNWSGEKLDYFSPAVNIFPNDEHSMFGEHKRSQKAQHNKPATSFTIFVASTEILKTVLDNIRDSIWWNHEAFFLLVNANSGNSCQIARQLLSTAWEFNVLFAVNICRDISNQLVLHTFNPYAKLAPKFWNVIQSDDTLDSPWTLLEHPLKELSQFLFVDGEYISIKIT